MCSIVIHVTGPVTINQPVDLTPVLEALAANAAGQGAIMTALEDLQAADLELDAEVTALVTEQATFLTDIAAALAAAGTDPTALAAVTADVQAQAQKLADLAAAQVAADPAAPVV